MSDYFKGTAPYYARYRSQYPPDFFNTMADLYHLDGTGVLLDLGCGTGQLGIPFASYFAEVIGMDPEPEMLDEAKRVARERAVLNVRWVEGASQDVTSAMGEFRLTTIGTAFHWMEQDAILQQLYTMTSPGGGVVIVDGSNGRPIGADYSVVVREVIHRYIGERRRAGSGHYTTPPDRYEDIIARSPFRVGETYRFSQEHIRTIDDVIGFYYSTSYASPFVLGDKQAAFERDMREALISLKPSGVFRLIEEFEAFTLHKD